MAEASHPFDYEYVYKDITIFEYSSCNIIFGETLGEGMAMNVYEGTCNINGVEKRAAFKYPRQLASRTLRTQNISNIFNGLDREIRYMNRLKNAENIVQCYGLVRKDDDRLRPILVLELATCNLEEYLQDHENEEQDWEKNLNFCLQIAKGAYTMHNERIIHGDIKGTNILVFENKEGTVTLKLCDFGFSSSLSSSIGRTGKTIQFTAPECLQAAQIHPVLQKYYNSSPNCPSRQLKDIYSYGLVVWQIANKGQVPYSALNDFEIEKKKMAENLDDLLSKLPEDTPSSFRDIIRVTTKFRPDERELLPEIISRISKLLNLPRLSDEYVHVNIAEQTDINSNWVLVKDDDY